MANLNFIQKIKESVKTRFELSKRVLSFDEYFESAQLNSYLALRDSPNYLLDAIEHFGAYDVEIRGRRVRRHKIFDQVDRENPQPVVGQEQSQNRLVQTLTGFARSGKTNKLIILHGPNGSAKSSFVRNFLEGLEAYSQTEPRALFQFCWVFPTDAGDKATLGLGASRKPEDAQPESGQSYAKLEQNRMDAIVRSELHENPLYLIPKEFRKELIANWIKGAEPTEAPRLEALKSNFLNGELSHKNALIYEALLNNYSGDYKRVLRHVRVERIYLSRRFRKSLVTVEPQLTVDAHIRQVTLDKSMANLPPALQSLSLFQLEGDLVDGNRGLVEYTDFLKRPIEHFKYLLGTCETGTVNLANVVAYLDSVFVATTDEKHLDGFREHPEYSGFKSRLEFVKLPYLLRYSEEERIYTDTAQHAAGPKELMPHTTKALGLWAVMTRLKRPQLKNKSAALTRVLEGLSPLAKAKLYDSAELPEKLSDEERREIRSHLEELIEEQQNQPYYEGILGASARELKTLIQVAAQNEEFATLGPAAIFFELRKMVKRPIDFEYLRLEPNHGYHAFEEMIDGVHHEWLNWVDREMRICLDLHDDLQFQESLSKYVNQASHSIRGEKIRNRITGKSEVADQSFLGEFEHSIGLSGDVEEYRKNLVSRLGAWAVENPGFDAQKDGLPYAEIFPDLMTKLRNQHHEQQVTKIKAMGEFLQDVENLVAGADDRTLNLGAQMAIKAYQGLQQKFGYGPKGAKEALVELSKTRYV